MRLMSASSSWATACWVSIIAELIYREFPAEPEGKLARRFAGLVRKEALARVAEAIDLGPHLRVSRGEAEQGRLGSLNLLADSCEAVIAALFLDGGYPAAQRFVERWWRPLIDRAGRAAPGCEDRAPGMGPGARSAAAGLSPGRPRGAGP